MVSLPRSSAKTVPLPPNCSFWIGWGRSTSRKLMSLRVSRLDGMSLRARVCSA